MTAFMTFLSEELADLKRQSLKRSLRVVDQMDGPRLTIGGRSFLNFSSNNYLGLARHPQVVEAAREVLSHWGAGATSSRLISGTTIIHGDLESALAAFLNKEAALLFPTGYMANLGVVTSLVGAGDAVVADRLSHASLIDAVRLSGARLWVYKHADAADAERVLKRAVSYRKRLLITESVFSMDGDFAPLMELAELCERYGAVGLVDEAHAIGVWGESGRGLTAGQFIMSFPAATGGESSIDDAPPTGALGGDDKGAFDVMVGTLSKSLGSQGGFVAGSQELIDTLINKARAFIFTTGLSPVCVAAAQAALSLIQEDPKPRERVQALSAKLREGLKALGFDLLGSESQIVPVLLGSPEAALACAGHLWEVGIFAPAIRPPTVHVGACRIRFSVTAEHTEKDIDQVIKAMSTLIPPDPFPLKYGEGEKSILRSNPSPYLRERGKG